MYNPKTMGGLKLALKDKYLEQGFSPEQADEAVQIMMESLTPPELFAFLIPDEERKRIAEPQTRWELMQVQNANFANYT